MRFVVYALRVVGKSMGSKFSVDYQNEVVKQFNCPCMKLAGLVYKLPCLFYVILAIMAVGLRKKTAFLRGLKKRE